MKETDQQANTTIEHYQGTLDYLYYAAKHEMTLIKDNKRRRYVAEVLHLTRTPGRKLAYHAFCHDGTMSAVLMLVGGYVDVLIPIDYSLMDGSDITKYLEAVPWEAIVDFKPFNELGCGFYVDHHATALNMKKRAEVIHYDPEAPCAAAMIFLSLFKYAESSLYDPNIEDLNLDPYWTQDALKFLVDVVKVTDTFTYAIPPPIGLIRINENDPPLIKNGGLLINSKSELVSTQLTFDESVWLVADAFRYYSETESALVNNSLVIQIAENGIETVLNSPGVMDFVHELRKDRFYAELIVERTKRRIKDPEKTMILILDPNSRDRMNYFNRAFSDLGVPVVFTVNARVAEGKYTLSLRHSASFKGTKKEEFYKVNELAKASFNGGGHKGASGGWFPWKEHAKSIEIMKEWGIERVLEMITINGVEPKDMDTEYDPD